MKKYIIYIIALSACITMSACEVENPESENAYIFPSEETETSSQIIISEPEKTETDNLVSETTASVNHSEKKTFQKFSIEINDDTRPEVYEIRVTAVCKGDIQRNIYVSDLYNINVLHSGVVGLVGAPVEITFSENVENTVLSFCYDKDNLRGIPEDNLLVLHYNDAEGFYDEIPDFKINKSDCTVNVSVDDGGVYMLADAYQWLGCWGADVSQYAYEIDKSQYISDWERECNTGDIMEIADTQWAMENAPSFRVSTPQQLAGVVYYVNAISEGNEEISVYLENDIDLSGYEWVPMGWDGSGSNSFSGIIDGQGHTISNMKINAGEFRTAFIGYGLNTQVYDISFVNADVSGSSYTGIVGGEIYMSSNWHDIHVSGKVTATGANDYGTIVGREAGLSFKNCTYDVTVNGEPFDYPSYLKKVEAETEVVEAFTLFINDDGLVERTEANGYDNLTWRIIKDGEVVLERNAENELVLTYGGDEVYLTAFIDGYYQRVSNIIKFD